MKQANVMLAGALVVAAAIFGPKLSALAGG